jgi:aminoglycoside 6'-N-acetyltransferase
MATSASAPLPLARQWTLRAPPHCARFSNAPAAQWHDRDVSTLTFRPLTRTDFALLGRWLAQPHVARRWNHEHSPQAMEADFGAVIDRLDPADVFIVSLEAQPIGLLQRYTFADNPGYVADLAGLIDAPAAALSIDYLIGEPELLGRGIGSAMIRAAVDAIWRDHPAAPSIIVPVSTANVASWRALERAGFTLAATGWLEPDNPIDDGDHRVYRIERHRATTSGRG